MTTAICKGTPIHATDMRDAVQNTSRGYFSGGFKLKTIVFLLFLAGTLIMTVVADRIVGSFIEQPSDAVGLIFPPDSALAYDTPEFSFTADINRMGFRDRDFATEKKAKIRVLAIGDSFTFGWGVNAAQSWPKVLEANLRGQGRDVEIANLGQPGAYPLMYARTAARAIPLLKPDLVIVAITQGDDLAQMKEVTEPPPAQEQASDAHHPTADGEQSAGGDSRTLRLAGRLYPYFLYLLRRRAVERQVVSSVWKSQTAEALQAATPAERERFESLDTEVKEYYLDGKLNPALLGTLRRPDYFMETFDTDKPRVRAMISAMATSLASVKDAAARSGAEMLVVSIPYKVYASRRDLESSRRLGLTLVPEMATANSAGEAVALACKEAGVRYVDVTAAFRERANESSFFFELDGHFNPAGHEAFAGLLTTALEVRE